MQMMFFV
jgi:hypothetical protein